MGRLFDPAIDDDGSAPVAVLSFRFWQRQFNSDPSIVGKTIRLGGELATVIGVASESFANLGTDNPDVWVPLLQHSYFVEGSKPITDPNFEGLILMSGASTKCEHAGGERRELADQPIAENLSSRDLG